MSEIRYVGFDYATGVDAHVEAHRDPRTGELVVTAHRSGLTPPNEVDDLFNRLAVTSPVVHSCLHHAKQSGLSERQALMLIAITLSKANDKLMEAATTDAPPR